MQKGVFCDNLQTESGKFYLTSSTILSGDGSQDSPYNVEEDWAWFDSNQVLQ